METSLWFPLRTSGDHKKIFSVSAILLLSLREKGSKKANVKYKNMDNVVYKVHHVKNEMFFEKSNIPQVIDVALY